MLKADLYTKMTGRNKQNDVILKIFFGVLIPIGVYKFKIENVL